MNNGSAIALNPGGHVLPMFYAANPQAAPAPPAGQLRGRTAANFTEQYATALQQFNSTLQGLMDPAQPMVVPNEVLSGVNTAVQNMQRAVAVSEATIPTLQSGLTGSALGHRTGLATTVATGLTLMIPLGMDLYKLFEGGSRTNEQNIQLITQIATEAVLIVSGAVWYVHSQKVRREAELSKVNQAQVDQAKAWRDWLHASADLDRVIQQLPNDSGTQATRFCAAYAAWRNLPAAQKDVTNIDLFIEQHLRALPLVANDLGKLFTSMRDLARSLSEQRAEFLVRHHIPINVGQPNATAVLKALKGEAPERVAAWKETRRKLSDKWLELMARIGPFTNFSVGAQSYRCRWPGEIYAPTPQEMAALDEQAQTLAQQHQQQEASSSSGPLMLDAPGGT